MTLLRDVDQYIGWSCDAEEDIFCASLGYDVLLAALTWPFWWYPSIWEEESSYRPATRRVKRSSSHPVLNNGHSLNEGQDDGEFDPCFLRGSLIETPEGEVPVEQLCPGHEVYVFENGKKCVRKIIWAGCGFVQVSPDLPDDLARYAVRIVRDALAPDIPSVDLLLTAEHCLYLERAFIPVRMLVNGRSIFYDRTIAAYNYYHFCTEKHSVVRANNVLTETFLDTGNHRTFFFGRTKKPEPQNILLETA